MKDSKLCLSATDISGNTGLSLSTIRKLTRSGEIPHIRVGRRILYPVAEIEEWLRSQTVGITPPSKESDTIG
ncbi:MAG TPA: helix-turn-helix domain-containing protein [Ruminococcus sp.]|nr:helix-turn-helix domain-containing protein [Ruminococcus sp.]